MLTDQYGIGMEFMVLEKAEIDIREYIYEVGWWFNFKRSILKSLGEQISGWVWMLNVRQSFSFCRPSKITFKPFRFQFLQLKKVNQFLNFNIEISNSLTISLFLRKIYYFQGWFSGGDKSIVNFKLKILWIVVIAQNNSVIHIHLEMCTEKRYNKCNILLDFSVEKY